MSFKLANTMNNYLYSPSSLEMTIAPGAKVVGGDPAAFVAGTEVARSPKTSTKRSFEEGAGGGWLLVGVPAMPSKSPVVAGGLKQIGD